MAKLQPLTRLANGIPYIDRVPTARLYAHGAEDAGRGLTGRKILSVAALAIGAAAHTYAVISGIRRGEFHAQAFDASPIDAGLAIVDYSYAALHGVMGAVQARLAGNLFLDRSCPEPIVARREPHPVVDGASFAMLEGSFFLTDPNAITDIASSIATALS